MFFICINFFVVYLISYPVVRIFMLGDQAKFYFNVYQLCCSSGPNDLFLQFARIFCIEGSSNFRSKIIRIFLRGQANLPSKIVRIFCFKGPSEFFHHILTLFESTLYFHFSELTQQTHSTPKIANTFRTLPRNKNQISLSNFLSRQI